MKKIKISNALRNIVDIINVVKLIVIYLKKEEMNIVINIPVISVDITTILVIFTVLTVISLIMIAMSNNYFKPIHVDIYIEYYQE